MYQLQYFVFPDVGKQENSHNGFNLCFMIEICYTIMYWHGKTLVMPIASHEHFSLYLALKPDTLNFAGIQNF